MDRKRPLEVVSGSARTGCSLLDLIKPLLLLINRSRRVVGVSGCGWMGVGVGSSGVGVPMSFYALMDLGECVRHTHPSGTKFLHLHTVMVLVDTNF